MKSKTVEINDILIAFDKMTVEEFTRPDGTKFKTVWVYLNNNLLFSFWEYRYQLTVDFKSDKNIFFKLEKRESDK